MIGRTLVSIIDTVAYVLVLIVIVDILVSYFLSPHNAFRSALDRIVTPMLSPIRKVVPLVGMLDFSPVVLIILIQVASFLLKMLVSFL